MKLGALLIRAVVGPLFFGHGSQKLFGWFGGYGLEGTGGFFETLGLRPGKRHAAAAGAAEAVGGALLTLGLLTPVASTLVSGTMVTAIRKVHASKGPWVTEGGFEYNAVLIALMTALAENGPGALALDRALLPDFKGRGWAVLSLGSAVAGSYLGTSPLLNEAPADEQADVAIAGDPASAGGTAAAQPTAA